MSLARVLMFGLGLHFKMLSRSPFDLFVVVASPLIFATLAYFLFQDGHGQSLLVASPTPFWAVVLPISVAISAIGVYSLAIGLVYVRVFYGVAITVHEWLAFGVAIPAAIGAIGSLGFLFASALVRYRSAFMLGNLFDV